MRPPSSAAATAAAAAVLLLAAAAAALPSSRERDLSGWKEDARTGSERPRGMRVLVRWAGGGGCAQWAAPARSKCPAPAAPALYAVLEPPHLPFPALPVRRCGGLQQLACTLLDVPQPLAIPSAFLQPLWRLAFLLQPTAPFPTGEPGPCPCFLMPLPPDPPPPPAAPAAAQRSATTWWPRRGRASRAPGWWTPRRTAGSRCPTSAPARECSSTGGRWVLRTLWVPFQRVPFQRVQQA